MADEIIAALGEFSLHVAAKLMGKTVVTEHKSLANDRLQPKRTSQLDQTALANSVLDSCVAQASQVVAKLGVIDQLQDERGDFGVLVGIIAREQVSLIEYLTGMQLSLTRDCTRNIGETCMRAVLALRDDLS